MEKLKIIECPRDAMQGWKNPIDTDKKIEYLSLLAKVGFDTIDFGSFVSSRIIPQMADTPQVFDHIHTVGSKSKWLAIVANLRGAEESMGHKKIDYLGFPFSISDTFQKLNANSSVAASFNSVNEIQQLCQSNNKELVVYISMAFGNPYGDEYSENIVMEAIERIAKMNVHIISLADTVGLATPEQVSSLVQKVISGFPKHEIGVHLHSQPENREAKIEAAFNAGCRRFDGAIKGYGGCPMSGNALVGNIDTGWMVRYFKKKGFLEEIDDSLLREAEMMASKIFV